MVNNLAIFIIINERKLSASFMSQIDIQLISVMLIVLNETLSKTVGQQ